MFENENAFVCDKDVQIFEKPFLNKQTSVVFLALRGSEAVVVVESSFYSLRFLFDEGLEEKSGRKVTQLVFK